MPGTTHPSHAYFTVALSEPGAEAALRAYLYGHTAIIGQHAQPGDVTVFLCETLAHTPSEALRLCQYQADRLGSGLHMTSPVTASIVEAMAYVEGRWGAKAMFTPADLYCAECNSQPGEPCDPFCTAPVAAVK